MRILLTRGEWTATRIAIAILALAGIGIMAYLTYIHYANARSFCDLSREVSCDVVTTSLYSEIFKIPISIGGLAYFLLVLFLAASNTPNAFQLLFLATLFMLIPSLFLSLLEIFVIKSVCILCETSKVLMAGILGISVFTLRLPAAKLMRLAAPILIAGVAASGVMYFAQTGTIAKKDYSALVVCLNENDVVYYKSVRCSTCRRQEKLLGDAYKQLNSVECHPDGENPQPELCLNKGITKTPTFLIEEQGREIKRAEGLQQTDELAVFANCPLELAE
ncbi:MAG: vitamin K epoxide reductase family protein [Candidatus Niyogibacteria bacterium]|nr:vitamin K epoxide reductase family protein [Candidatus Niyogibacteria bacterium]